MKKDPRDLNIGTAVKVGSILVHVEEAMSADGHNLDVHALRALLTDADVQEWLGRFDQVMLPRKRATDLKEHDFHDAPELADGSAPARPRRRART